MKKIIIISFLLLGGCATNWNNVPPLYGCQELSEFGCPDIEPADDPLDYPTTINVLSEEEPK